MNTPNQTAPDRDLSAKTLFEKAYAAHQSGQLDEALLLYRQVIEVEPNHVGALTLAGILSCQSGDHEEGIRLIQSAIEIQPKNLDALFNLGTALEGANRFEEAEATFRKVIARKPDIIDAWQNLAAVLDKQGKAPEAEQILREIMLNDPKAKKGIRFNELICRQIKNGRLKEALETCDLYYQIFPWNMFALALKGFVLNEMGNTESAKHLFDYKRLVKTVKHTTVPGYSDIASFNDELKQFALSHPTLVFEPDQKSTRGGSQTAIFETDTSPPFLALRSMIETTVSEYAESVAESDAQSPAHPFLSPMPKKFSLSIWATTLTGPGHQSPHFHPSGWLSGVYYVSLPNTISEDDQSKAGWLEYGKPKDHFGLTAAPLTSTVQPEEGLMVLFPSYFYHRTIPFDINAGPDNNQTRISFAFDAVPQS
jgi:Flp pilus assembly protein TadD